MIAGTQTHARGAALVTGATSGLGYELALLLARNGHPLVVVARRQADLDRVAGELRDRHSVPVETIVADLARPEAVETIVAELERRRVAVEILINNAGFASYGPFAESNPSREVDMIQVNVVALTHLTRLLLPGMLARRRGRILNVASTAAFEPGPLMAVYYATKAYVLSFSEAIASELRGSGVTVTALCPGPTATGFQRRAAMEDSKLVSGRTLMDARTVAEAGYAAMLAGKTVVIPGWRNWLMAEAVRFAPRNLTTAIVRRMQERVEAH